MSDSASSRARARPPRRSLKAALSEAGLGETAPGVRAEPRAVRSPERPAPVAPSAPIAAFAKIEPPAGPEVRTPPPPLVSPGLSYFMQPTATPARARPVATRSVVSPPPWLRAARRGRWHALVLNAFGWLITLAVAGSIIGIAGRHLAVAPAGFETVVQAHQ